MSLDTSTSGGAQQATQNPQPSVNGLGGGVQADSVQPVATSSLLVSNNGGVPLNQTNVTTVNFDETASAATSQPATAAHHYNYGLIWLPLLLLVFAASLFWFMSHTAKNTTNSSK